jgi:hypothetical protein
MFEAGGASDRSLRQVRLVRHAVRNRPSHAGQAVHEDAVIIFGIPVIKDGENDQRSHQKPHRISPKVRAEPENHRGGRTAVMAFPSKCASNHGIPK